MSTNDAHSRSVEPLAAAQATALLSVPAMPPLPINGRTPSPDSGAEIDTRDQRKAREFFQQERDEAQQAGTKAEGLGIRWTDVSVSVNSLANRIAPSLDRTLIDAAGGWAFKAVGGGLRRLAGSRRGGGQRYILQGSTGLLHQGETLLVLGRPGAGVSTLLRALACEWEGLNVRGFLDYQGLKPKDLQGRYAGEVCYLAEDDLHFATLSVKSTLNVALASKTPRTRGKESRSHWRHSRLEALARFLGLSGTLSTPVGNEGLRGVSGGERKRVSVAELLATRASVMLLDNATNGLDSSTALALVSLLRDVAQEGKRSIVAGLRQVGEDVFNTFDKVLVLDRGQQVFFGPVSAARTHFEELGFEAIPGQTTADFLCACTDPRSRRAREGFENRLPRSSDDLARAFRSSNAFAQLQSELKQATYRNHEARANVVALRKALRAEKDHLTPGRSIFTVNFGRQVAILTVRQYELIRADLPAYITKTAVNIALSLLVGTLFFQQPVTTDGAFTRGSVLLLALLFNGYLQLAELGNTLVGRPIVRRHRHFGFYSPSALALARVLSDVPLIAVQVAIFATITYLLAGLQASLERFLIYLLVIFVMALNLTTVFRTFAAFSPSINEALRYCGVALNIFVVYGGFFIPAPAIKPWLQWLHLYFDPVSQAYEAVVSNEFDGLKLACSEQDIVPRGPGYDDVRYQTCAFTGSTPGSLTVDGAAYIREAFTFEHDRLWANLLILVIQALVFLLIGVLSTELLHFAPSGSMRLFLGTKAAKKRLRRAQRLVTDEEEADVEPLLSASSSDNTLNVANGHQHEQGATLTWRDLTLSVMMPNECRTLLRDVSGYIKPGQVTALMGPSGAGKTTLLDALVGRSQSSHIEGSILVDGREATPSSFRNTGYVEQLDLHDEYATVREAVEFSALLRQDASLSREEKLAHVDEVLDLLDLTHLQDAIVGTTRAGLGLEQRKRLTIAVELVSRPKILALDEPTSGLDSSSAQQIVACMHRLSRTGIPVLATIHQPSAELFASFDQLLLLEKGGRQAYFGSREGALDFFGRTGGKECPKDANPAEYLLDALGDFGGKDDGRRPSVRWARSEQAQKLQKDIQDADKRGSMQPSSIHEQLHGASFLAQTTELTKRMSRNFYRDVSFSYSKIFTTLVVAVIIGISFFQQDNSIVGMQNKTFSVFLLLFIPPVFINAVIQKVYTLRTLFLTREKPSHTYGLPAFCASLLLADLPYALGCGMLFVAVVYPLVGYPAELKAFFYVFAMIEIFFVFQCTLALALTALTRSAGVVANLLPFFLVSMEAFNGSLMYISALDSLFSADFRRSYRQIPSYWRWLYWMSPFMHYIKGVLGVILHSQPIECLPQELVTFYAPPDQSCISYASGFLQSHAGRLVEDAIDGACRFCHFGSGDEYLATLNISHSDRWLSLAVMAGYTLFNVLAFLALSLLPRPSFASLLGRKRTLTL